MTREQAKELLQLPNAEFTEAELKKAYRKQAKINHPDVGGSEEKMALITKAYEFLLNPVNNQRMTITHNGILDVVMC